MTRLKATLLTVVTLAVMAITSLFIPNPESRVMAATNYPAEAVESYKSINQVSTFTALQRNMEKDGNIEVILTADINYTIDDLSSNFISEVIKIKNGDKYINLNGHNIHIVYNRTAADGESVLFSVQTDATFVIYDTEDKGTINYDCSLENEYSPYIVQRNLIYVNGGTLRFNSGNLVAGRSYKFYSASKATYYYKQINGTAITINGGRVYINGGHIEGRGFRKHTKAGDNETVADAAIYCMNGGVYINDGELIGKGCADCISRDRDDAIFHIYGGYFNVEKQDYSIVLTKSVSSAYGTKYGNIGMYHYEIQGFSQINEYKRGNIDVSKISHGDYDSYFLQSQSRLNITPPSEVYVSISRIDSYDDSSTEYEWNKIDDMEFKLKETGKFSSRHFLGEKWWLMGDRENDHIKEHNRTIIYTLNTYKDGVYTPVATKESTDGTIKLSDFDGSDINNLKYGTTYYLRASFNEHWKNKREYNISYCTGAKKIKFVDPFTLEGGSLYTFNASDGNGAGVIPENAYSCKMLDKMINNHTIDSYVATFYYTDKTGHLSNYVYDSIDDPMPGEIIFYDIIDGVSEIQFSIVFRRGDKEIEPAYNTATAYICSIPPIKAYDASNNTELSIVNDNLYVKSEIPKVTLETSLPANENIRWVSWNKIWGTNTYSIDSHYTKNQTSITIDLNNNFGLKWYSLEYRVNGKSYYSDRICVARDDWNGQGAITAEIREVGGKTVDGDSKCTYTVNKSNHESKIGIHARLNNITSDNANLTANYYYTLDSYPRDASPKRLVLSATKNGNTDRIKFSQNQRNLAGFFTDNDEDSFDNYELPEGIYSISGYVEYTLDGTNYSTVYMTPVSVEIKQTFQRFRIMYDDTEVSEKWQGCVVNCVPGTSKILYAEPYPKTATIEGNVTWSSSDESVAAVNKNGVVTIKKIGTAVITCTCGNYSASTTICVPPTEAVFTIPEPVLGGNIPQDEVLEDNDYYTAAYSYNSTGVFVTDVIYYPTISIVFKDGTPFSVDESKTLIYDYSTVDRYFSGDNSAFEITVNGTTYYGDGSYNTSVTGVDNLPITDTRYLNYSIVYTLRLTNYTTEILDPNNDYISLLDVNLNIPADGQKLGEIEGFKDDTLGLELNPGIAWYLYTINKVAPIQLVISGGDDDDISNDVTEDFTEYEAGKTYRVRADVSDGKFNTDYTNSRGGRTYFDENLSAVYPDGKVIVEPIDSSDRKHSRTIYIYFTAGGESQAASEAETVDIHVHSTTPTHVAAKASTCKEKGNIEYYICEDCGSYFTEEACENEIFDKDSVVTDYAAHTLTKVEKADPGCETKGNIEYYVCSVCDKYFSDQAGTEEITDKASVITEKAGHEWGPWTVTKPATATEPGEEQRICKKDNSHIETRKTGILGHTHNLTIVPEVKATCEKTGMSAYYTCSGCEKIFSDATGTQEIADKATLVIPAKGHDLTITPEVKATCEVAGMSAYYTCSECNKIFSDAAGTQEVTDKKTLVIQATGHDWDEWKGTKAATDTEQGEEERVCKNDGSHKETRKVGILGHTHSLTLVPEVKETCETAGMSEYYTCSGCEKIFIDAAGKTEILDVTKLVILAKGHDWGEWTETKPVTETEHGEKQRVCKNDPSHIQTEIIPKKNSLQAGDKESVDGINYEIISPELAEVKVIGLSESNTEEVTIPDTVSIDGIDYHVKAIDDYAFFDNDAIKSLDINGDIEIGESAFAYCDGLENVVVSGEAVVGKSAFEGCETLKDVILKDGVKEIGESAFEGCCALESVVVPDSVTIIHTSSFTNTNNTYKMYANEGSEAYKYAQNNNINVAVHEHEWAKGWNSNATRHWHKCRAEGCDITDDADKSGYAEHEFGEWEVRTAATSVSDREEVRACTVCNYEETRVIPKHEHNWSEEYSNNATYHWHECNAEGCDISKNTDKEGYEKHSFGEWSARKAATADAEGEEVRICTVCKYEETKVIPKKTSEDEPVGQTDKTGGTSTGTQTTDKETTGGQTTEQNSTQSGPQTDEKTLLKAGSTFTYSNASYKVNDDMTLIYVKNTKTNASSVTVPDEVTYENTAYKVTEIGNSAFSNNKKLAKVTVGKNIVKIGKKAFYKCKKLKKITIKTSVLKSVGSNALKGVHKTCKIKVPKAKVKSYTSIFKKKGQGKKVKVTK